MAVTVAIPGDLPISEPVIGGAEARGWAEWGRMWPCVALANLCAYSK